MREEAYRYAIEEAHKQSTGTLVYAPHPDAGLGERQQINIWIHDRTPDFDFMRTLARALRSSALFVRDSGGESALA